MTASTAYCANAAMIYRFWLAAFESHAVAAGLLAQADAESSLNPKAVGDHGQAFGLDQWHGARAAVILKGCGVDLTRLPPIADQLKAALWELRGPEHFALQKILAAKTAWDAGYAACRYWERPGSTLQYAKRGDKAEAWAVYFAKHPAA
ncbi:phage tail tip lysozyme [Rhodoblastus sp.]|uniref:phage tail tip lysozyme n=1 Tax=Rhodoblastus sp. TaxID=1962975 RepID=UPI00261513B8|nr:phage tail tip lysozyme [Rhodoblastus sp.]